MGFFFLLFPGPRWGEGVDLQEMKIPTFEGKLEKYHLIY